jgi:hypothetical protein
MLQTTHRKPRITKVGNSKLKSNVVEQMFFQGLPLLASVAGAFRSKQKHLLALGYWVPPQQPRALRLYRTLDPIDRGRNLEWQFGFVFEKSAHVI